MARTSMGKRQSGNAFDTDTASGLGLPGDLLLFMENKHPQGRTVEGVKPRDKILCKKRFYRYVVACMHNCPERHFCQEFWNFFEAKGLTPAEYFNEDGVGDAAMRRVVFDCDRCGKKDLDQVYGLYDLDGENPENRLDIEVQTKRVAEVGYTTTVVTELMVVTMEQLEKELGWHHFCDKCWGKMVESLAQLANQKKPAAPKKPKAAKKEPKAEVAEKSDKVGDQGLPL